MTALWWLLLDQQRTLLAPAHLPHVKQHHPRSLQHSVMVGNALCSLYFGSTVWP